MLHVRETIAINGLTRVTTRSNRNDIHYMSDNLLLAGGPCNVDFWTTLVQRAGEEMVRFVQEVFVLKRWPYFM